MRERTYLMRNESHAVHPDTECPFLTSPTRRADPTLPKSLREQYLEYVYVQTMLEPDSTEIA
jgi:hypothetical protein